MSEEKNVMQDALVSIIQKTQQGIDASVSFLSEQIPDVIQQLLMWKMVEALLVVLGCTVLLAFTLKFGIKGIHSIVNYQRGYHLYYNNSGDLGRQGKELMSQNSGTMPFSIISIISLAVAIIIFLANAPAAISTAAKIYIAPKVYLIEYAASLVK